MVPPAVLPNCYKIVIDPVGETECILNTHAQTLLAGSGLMVMPGKRLRVPGELINGIK